MDQLGWQGNEPCFDHFLIGIAQYGQLQSNIEKVLEKICKKLKITNFCQFGFSKNRSSRQNFSLYIYRSPSCWSSTECKDGVQCWWIWLSLHIMPNRSPDERKANVKLVEEVKNKVEKTYGRLSHTIYTSFQYGGGGPQPHDSAQCSKSAIMAAAKCGKMCYYSWK